MTFEEKLEKASMNLSMALACNRPYPREKVEQIKKYSRQIYDLCILQGIAYSTEAINNFNSSQFAKQLDP